jgi:hypothetical protein
LQYNQTQNLPKTNGAKKKKSKSKSKPNQNQIKTKPKQKTLTKSKTIHLHTPYRCSHPVPVPSPQTSAGSAIRAPFPVSSLGLRVAKAAVCSIHFPVNTEKNIFTHIKKKEKKE